MLALAVAALLTLPQPGVLVPGKSLAGISLGAREAKVRAAWGPQVGVCSGCRRRTLYFTYGPFNPVGVGAEFVRRRVVALYTLWSPSGWRTREGVTLGAGELTVTGTYRGMVRADCGHYYAFTLRRSRVATAFWFRDGVLWAFGLLRPSLGVCR